MSYYARDRLKPQDIENIKRRNAIGVAVLLLINAALFAGLIALALITGKREQGELQRRDTAIPPYKESLVADSPSGGSAGAPPTLVRRKSSFTPASR